MREDRDRFWKALEPEYSGAMMFCRKLMSDRERGDDLFQDALLIAYTRFHSLRDPGAFRPWLYRIMVNAFRSEVRRPWWKRQTPLTAEAELKLTGENPVEAYNARRWLASAFKVLSPDQQALVTLHELEGWTLAELAELYGKKEGSLKARLFRARRKLRKTLLAMASRSQSKGEVGPTDNKDETCTVAKPDTD